MKWISLNKIYLFISILLLFVFRTASAEIFPEESKGEDIWQLELGSQYVHQSNALASLYGRVVFGSSTNVTSTNFLDQVNELIAPDPEDEWGIAGRLGYVFDSHKYDVQLRYFGVFSDNDVHNQHNTISNGPVVADRYSHANLNTAELMFGIYHQLTRRLDVRTSYGVAFADIDQKSNAMLSSSVISPFATTFNTSTTFVGAGPKVRADAWFGLIDNFWVVGELGIAALLGSSELKQETILGGGNPSSNHFDSQVDQVAVGIDTTLGLKYGYEFKGDMVLNLEAGYKFAAYLNAFEDEDFEYFIASSTEALFYDSVSNYTYSGPYINVALDFW